MKNETRIRELSLRIIQILVLFEILWAAVFLVGLTLKWSGITDQLTSAFFAAGFCSLILISALAILNITANLNIIAKAAEVRVAVPTTEVAVRGSYWPMLAIAGGLVVFVVGALTIAEARLYRAKKSEVETKIESVIDTPLLISVLDVVKRDGTAKELRNIRDALAAAIQVGDRVSLLVPRKLNGVSVYYELTGWWWGGNEDVKISELSIPRFNPSVNEANEFKALTEGKIDRFSLKAGTEIRSFRRVVRPEAEIIILIDTNRQQGDRKLSS